MSNTIRKDKNGKEYKESLKKKDGHFRCRCEYCLGKKDVIEKIAENRRKRNERTDRKLNNRTKILQRRVF